MALDLPLQAPEGTRLSSDYVLHSERPLGALTRWRLRSAPPLRFETELAPAQGQRALALPPGYTRAPWAWPGNGGNRPAPTMPRSRPARCN